MDASAVVEAKYVKSSAFLFIELRHVFAVLTFLLAFLLLLILDAAEVTLAVRDSEVTLGADCGRLFREGLPFGKKDVLQLV